MRLRGIFTRVFRMFAFLNLLFLVGAFLTSFIPRIKTTKMNKQATPDFYIYGAEETVFDDNNNLTKDDLTLYTSDGSSGTWKKSATKNGTYTDVSTGTSLVLGKDDSDVAGYWFKCNNSEPIRVLRSVKENRKYTIDGMIATIYTSCQWFVTGKDENIAYQIVTWTDENNRTTSFINIIAKYDVQMPISDDENYQSEYAGETIWIQTSYTDSWKLFGTEDENPTSDSYVTLISDTKAYVSNDGVVFTSKLGENQKSMCLYNDVQLADDEAITTLFPGFNPDKAPIYAVLKNEQLDYIYMVGAPRSASENLKALAPAFTLAPINQADMLDVCALSQLYRFYTNKNERETYLYDRFNGIDNVVVGAYNVDTGLSVSWINRNPGDEISFVINAGVTSGMSQLKSPVQKVKDLIDDIGEVEYTPESKEKIDAAREAFNELDATDKASVDATRLAQLEKAEEDYFKAMVEALKPFTSIEHTAEVNAAIEEATEYYNNLSSDQKANVSSSYNDLQTAKDNYIAKEVEDLIDGIGEVEYTPESKAKIDAAKEAYDALTPAQKELVSNYTDLVESEETYEAKELVSLIEKINDPTNPATKEEIEQMREAYDSLSESQKLLVTNYEMLTQKEDELKAEEVKDLIEAIGEVEYTPESKAKIDAAREAYDALTPAQKQLVLNYEKLTTAEGVYTQKAQGTQTDPTPGVDPIPGANPENPTEKGDNEGDKRHGFCAGYVVMIVSILGYLFVFLFAILRFGLFKGLVKKCNLDKLYTKTTLFEFISVFVSGALFLFALIALVFHQCPAAIVFFILDFLVFAAVLVLFIIDQQLNKKSEEVKEDKE